MTIRIETPAETPDIAPTVELFSIDDVSYYIPAKPRPNISLKYLRLVRTQGEAFAASYLLEALLGKAGFDALCEYDDLTDEQYRGIIKAARTQTMGSVVPDKS